MAGTVGRANAATEIAREHNAMEALATRITGLGHGSERTALVHELCARFMIHTQAEERYVNPAVRRLLPNGASVAASQTVGNRAVAGIVASVERGDAEGARFDDLVGRLVDGVRGHIVRQDAMLLPALIEAFPLDEIGRLGVQLREGIRAARDAAVRAGIRACEQGGQLDGEPCGGFRALLQRIARDEMRGAPALSGASRLATRPPGHPGSF